MDDIGLLDNRPEWGWCKTEGCDQEAFPIWLSGDYPDEPDLLLCPKHIGARIRNAETEKRAWTEIGAKAEARADAAELEFNMLHDRYFELGKQLGRCDAAFELIIASTSLPDVKRLARKLRGELQQKGGSDATHNDTHG